MRRRKKTKYEIFNHAHAVVFKSGKVYYALHLKLGRLYLVEIDPKDYVGDDEGGIRKYLITLPEFDNVYTIQLALMEAFLHRSLKFDLESNECVYPRLAIALLSCNPDIYEWKIRDFRRVFAGDGSERKTELEGILTENPQQFDLEIVASDSEDEDIESPFFEGEAYKYKKIIDAYLKKKPGKKKDHSATPIGKKRKGKKSVALEEVALLNHALQQRDLSSPRVEVDRQVKDSKAYETVSLLFSESDHLGNKESVPVQPSTPKKPKQEKRSLRTSFLVAQFRGINYISSRWGDQARRAHRGFNHKGHPYFSEGVMNSTYRYFTEEFTPGTFLKHSIDENEGGLLFYAKEYREILLALRNSDFVLERNSKTAPGSDYYIYSNMTNWIQHTYSNGIVKLLDTMRYLQKNQNTFPFRNALNPFVSTSDLIDHAVRYSLGDKNPYMDIALTPHYQISGKPKKPCVGKIFASLHSIGDYLLETSPNIVRVLNKTGDNRTKDRVFSEFETSFLGYIEKERIIADVKVVFPDFSQAYSAEYFNNFGINEEDYNTFHSRFISIQAVVDADLQREQLLSLEAEIVDQMSHYYRYLLYMMVKKAAPPSSVVLFIDDDGSFTFNQVKKNTFKNERKEARKRRNLLAKRIWQQEWKKKPPEGSLLHEDINTRSDGRPIRYFKVDPELVKKVAPEFFKQCQLDNESPATLTPSPALGPSAGKGKAEEVGVNDSFDGVSDLADDNLEEITKRLMGKVDSLEDQLFRECFRVLLKSTKKVDIFLNKVQTLYEDLYQDYLLSGSERYKFFVDFVVSHFAFEFELKKEYCLKITDTVRDGNCFFHAVYGQELDANGNLFDPEADERRADFVEWLRGSEMFSKIQIENWPNGIANPGLCIVMLLIAELTAVPEGSTEEQLKHYGLAQGFGGEAFTIFYETIREEWEQIAVDSQEKAEDERGVFKINEICNSQIIFNAYCQLLASSDYYINDVEAQMIAYKDNICLCLKQPNRHQDGINTTRYNPDGAQGYEIFHDGVEMHFKRCQKAQSLLVSKPALFADDSAGPSSELPLQEVGANSAASDMAKQLSGMNLE